MFLAHKAWNSIAPQTIKNCWRHTGIFTPKNAKTNWKAQISNQGMASAIEGLEKQLKSLSSKASLTEANPEHHISLDLLFNLIVEQVEPESEGQMRTIEELLLTTPAGQAVLPIQIDEDNE